MFWVICLKICYKILFISIFEIFKSENYWLVKCALIIGLNNSFTVFFNLKHYNLKESLFTTSQQNGSEI